MADFLSRVADQVFGRVPVVRPNLAPIHSTFAPRDEIQVEVDGWNEPPTSEHRPRAGAASAFAGIIAPEPQHGRRELSSERSIPQRAEEDATPAERHQLDGKRATTEVLRPGPLKRGAIDPPRVPIATARAQTDDEFVGPTPLVPVNTETADPGGEVIAVQNTWTPAGARPEPVVKITIGRVEVRAVQPLPAPVRTPAVQAPHLSLDDYLTQRREGLR